MFPGPGKVLLVLLIQNLLVPGQYVCDRGRAALWWLTDQLSEQTNKQP